MNGIFNSGQPKVMHYGVTVRRNYILFNFYLVTSIITILYFLYGFFPINYNEETIATVDDIPSSIDSINVDRDKVYKPEVQRVVLMVIDAMRWDFVHGPNSHVNMPHTSSFLDNGDGCLYKTKVHPPTVTLPRVKAIATGTVPNFIDVILNLGAPEIQGDSVLRQIKDHGYKIIFYGDLTWTLLFPDMFDRHEQTDTFMVSEYIEADLNVTAHMVREIHESDWSMMILHYSGLDHIGHLEGPYSPLIKDKLLEMDESIATIRNRVKEWNKEGKSTLFLITGDHGMMDTGSHGGSTSEETLVPLLVFGTPCTYKNNYADEQIAQIDIAPTLSVLLGVPIPFSSTGAIILNLMSNFTVSQKLYALHYNAKQLLYHFSKSNIYKSSEAYKNYQTATKLYAQWLHNHSDSADEMISMYTSSIAEMQNYLTSNLFRYNNFITSAALTIMIMILCLNVLMNKHRPLKWSFHKFLVFACTIFSLWLCFWSYLDFNAQTNWLSRANDVYTLIFAVFFVVVLLVSSLLFANATVPIEQIMLLYKNKSLTDLHVILPIATLAHAVNLGSSSYVEEEHQIWYFYCTSVLAYTGYEALRKSARNSSLKFSVVWLMFMVVCRVLTMWNSTGYQNRRAYDISDWLYEEPTKIALSLLLVFSLSSLVFMDYKYEEENHQWTSLVFNVLVSILIYLRHSAANLVVQPFFYPESRGITEVRLFWILTMVYMAISIRRLIIATRENKVYLYRLIFYLILKKWIIVSALLHRPHNVVLLPVQVLVDEAIGNYTRTKENRGLKVLLYIWSGNVFFFYQGNSNSLSSVDLKAGYIGLESYWPLITGTFLIINTYSAPILGLFWFLFNHCSENLHTSPKIIVLLCKQYAFWRLVPMVFYMIVMIINRYHISIWTVFSPKLFYEAAYTIILFVVILLLEIFFSLHHLYFQSCVL